MGCVSERLGNKRPHHAPAKSIRKTTGDPVEARRKTRRSETIEYANCVCINNVHTGAGKSCDTPGLHQQGAMIRVVIILKFSFLHSVL
jgi:hypothetical protein